MLSNRDVAMIRRGRRQLTREIAGYWMRTLAQVRIHWFARLETRFLLGRQLILVSEACRRVRLVLLIPVLSGLTGVVIKLRCAFGGWSPRFDGRFCASKDSVVTTRANAKTIARSRKFINCPPRSSFSRSSVTTRNDTFLAIVSAFCYRNVKQIR